MCDFQAIVATLPKRQRVSLIVEWWVEGQPFRLRLIVIWNKKTQYFIYRLTNLPEERYDIDKVCLISAIIQPSPSIHFLG